MIPERGADLTKVLEDVSKILNKDMAYLNDHPLSIMSITPHPLIKNIIMDNIEKNLGRGREFKGSAQIEREVIEMVGTLFHHSNPCGTATTGGTESNILAMYAFREISKNKTDTPNIIAPGTIHPSIHKAAKILQIKVITTPVDHQFQALPQSIAEEINKNTIGIFLTAGTTSHGQIDPIPEIGQIAHNNNIPVHVDAAFGGLVIPYLNDLGYSNHKFDFQLQGVTSISTDPHKMGLAPIPAGCLIFRSQKYLEAIQTHIPYLSGASSTQPTLLGTRPAYSMIAFWILLNHLGKEGYRKIVSECMQNTVYAQKRINEANQLDSILKKPIMNILGFTCQNTPLDRLIEALESKNWFIEKSPLPPSLRLIIMPHLNQNTLEQFFNELLNQIEKITISSNK